MGEGERIKEAIERNVKIVMARPSKGRGTAASRATLGAGLTCTVTEGSHTFRVGMPEVYGGPGDAPNPGVLGRAALASCLVLGIGMWAARMDIVLDALTVDVEADYDVRGELGIANDVPPGYGAMRYTIDARSAAPDVARARDARAGRAHQFVRGRFLARGAVERRDPREREVAVDADLQLRIQRYGWDKAAGEYERYWSQALEPAQNRLLQMASLRRGERVLDVACGTGLVSLRAASPPWARAARCSRRI